jgi:enoyl-[acyl-carrier protein] reductase II
MSLINFEIESINAVYKGDKEKALLAAGESAQRVNDLPKVNDLVQEIVTEAGGILQGVQKKFLS